MKNSQKYHKKGVIKEKNNLSSLRAERSEGVAIHTK